MLIKSLQRAFLRSPPKTGNVAPFRIVANVPALEKHVNFSERWSLRFLPAPALSHQIVDLLWTDGRLGKGSLHSVTNANVFTVVDDFLVRKRAERPLTRKSENLPEGHSK